MAPVQEVPDKEGAEDDQQRADAAAVEDLARGTEQDPDPSGQVLLEVPP
jgi:hypothetical protein